LYEETMMQIGTGPRGWAARLLLVLVVLLGLVAPRGVGGAAAASGGTVVAWGDNAWGQVGTTNETCGGGPCSRTPLAVLGGVVAVAGGLKHSLALKADGTVWSWGNNDQGQLGDGTTTARATPTRVKDLVGVIAIESGDYHCLAITHDGGVWAWGWNGFGQLGDGTTTNRSTPVRAKAPPYIRAVAGGGSHTLALRYDGTVWAWGGNDDGRLGDGTTTQRTTAVQVKGIDGIGVLEGITAIAAGTYHTLALSGDGTVWSWGWNVCDQLGHDEKDYLTPGGSNGTFRATPWPVLDPNEPGIFSPLSGVTAIAAGFLHSVALKGDGTVLTWGMNGSGQLGASSGNALWMKHPLTVVGPGGSGTLGGVVAVAAGGNRTFARRGDGSLWAWGENAGGALGDGDILPQANPVQVRAVGGQGPLGAVIAVAANPRHALALVESAAAPAPPPPPQILPPPPGGYTLGATHTTGGRVQGGGAYPAGAVATLTAQPESGQVFLGWTLDGRFLGWANPLTLTMDGSHSAVATFAPRPAFADVGSDVTGATEAVSQLAARSVVKGCDHAAGLFCPTEPTLRAQLAALLVRAMGWGGDTPPNPFADREGVDGELWDAVATLAARGVARGYDDGRYGTTEPVLNAQVISFITRAMVAKGHWQPQPDDGNVYPNVPTASGHRQDLATYAHYAGTVRGTAGIAGDFEGWDQPASRAWFAFALWQALDGHFSIDRVP
jgi:alpha-tubulin suppressor-like RCC1 family protein